MNSLTDRYLAAGIHFKTNEMTGLLAVYKKIAWSKKQYGYARINYYMQFKNNAHMFEQTGTSIYYAEKISREYKNNGDRHSLLEASQKCQVYMEQELLDKIIDVFKLEQAYLKILPGLLQQKRVATATGIDAIYLLSTTIMAYIGKKDTIAVYATAKLAGQIGQAIAGRYPINREHMLYNDFFTLERQHAMAIFEGDQAMVARVLDRIASLKTTYKDQVTGFIDLNLVQWRIDHYLAVHNADSALFYTQKFEALPSFDKDQQARIAEYRAKIQAMKGDLRGSNAALSQALEQERKVQAALMTEMTKLMYAYTEAENTKLDLQQSEAAKWQRTLWLLIISFFAALSVLAIYLTMLYRSRKAKARIAALNEAANMQVIAMEEAKYQAVRDEQQRLGQDLHDGLSSSIAAIRYQLEQLSMDATDEALKSKLDQLQEETAKAYEATRSKSHEWFNAAEEQQELSFAKEISLLTDSALPGSRYYKTIHIDDHSLVKTSTDTRIALLRIIQEAVTNIIKHARAKKVEILLYEEAEHLILTISDDGIGLGKQAAQKKSNLGLQSIRRRVEYLGGKINIDSEVKGTEITISIPLALPHHQTGTI
ncbi:MAG: hypothetical protein JNL13_05060 [Chitinophagaceae bacterium]|nr:hypothetical protein [Chitinophagaceae bacterium]